MPLAASERRSAPAVMLVRPAAAHQSSEGGLGSGLGSRVQWAPLVSRGLRSCPEGLRTAKVEVTRELSVGGGVAALLFTYSASHYLCLRPLDQVLTNRSGPRGAAPAGLS